jgi:hypothetical protein
LRSLSATKSPGTCSTRRIASATAKLGSLPTFGFRLDDWEALAHALREHARQNEVTVERETRLASVRATRWMARSTHLTVAAPRCGQFGNWTAVKLPPG